MEKHHQIVIIGGGTGGIMTAAQLKNKQPGLDMAILEPGKDHWYQPAWTLVGAGTFDFKKTRRDEAAVMPEGVTWIQEKAKDILPEINSIITAQDNIITYDYLVVAPGLVMNLDGIEGLREALKQPNVCSNYTDPEKTWQVLQNFKGGNAVFTHAATPIKCGGAPQKIMYLADDYFRKSRVRKNSRVVYATPGSVIFGVKEFAGTLTEIIKRKDVDLKTFYSPVKIDGNRQEVYFNYTGPAGTQPDIPEKNPLGLKKSQDGLIIMPYEMLHLAPPQQAPDFIRKSVLAVQEGPNKGWLDVNIHTMQHNRFANIFGLGDVAALPTAKTGAAIRKQAPVLVKHLLARLNHKPQPADQYEGYSSCPLVTGYGKMVLAEFKYNNILDSDPLLSKLVDTTKEQWSMWLLKKYALPWMYWNLMLKGRM